MSGKRVKKKRRTPTTKKILWLCLLNGLLAFMAALRPVESGEIINIAESLSTAAITEIIGVVLVYCTKALFEKRKDFGEVGKELNDE